MLEFHKDGDCFGIETTITNPDEFIQACSDLLEKHIDLNSFDGDWAFQLRGWLPQIASMYNHLGGLKLNPEVKPKPVYTYIVSRSEEFAVSLSRSFYNQTYEYAKAEFDSLKDRPGLIRPHGDSLSLYKVNTRTRKAKELEKATIIAAYALEEAREDRKSWT